MVLNTLAIVHSQACVTCFSPRKDPGYAKSTIKQNKLDKRCEKPPVVNLIQCRTFMVMAHGQNDKGDS